MLGILFGNPPKRAALNFLNFPSSWLKRYATDRINDHWCDILDLNFGLTPQSRISIYKWGADKFEKVINLKLPCISEFVDSFRKFSIEFPNEPNTKDNRWLEQPFFHNPKIQFGRGWAKKPFVLKIVKTDVIPKDLTSIVTGTRHGIQMDLLTCTLPSQSKIYWLFMT